MALFLQISFIGAFDHGVVEVGQDPAIWESWFIVILFFEVDGVIILNVCYNVGAMRSENGQYVDRCVGVSIGSIVTISRQLRVGEPRLGRSSIYQLWEAVSLLSLNGISTATAFLAPSQ